MERTLYFVSLGVICLITLAVFLFLRFSPRRRAAQALAPVGSIAAEPFPLLDAVILSLCFLGLFLMPTHLRVPLLKKPLQQLKSVNFPCVLAVLLSFIRIKRWEKIDWIMAILWLLMIIPMFVSNQIRVEQTRFTALFQSLFPLFLVFFRMNPVNRQKTLNVFMLFLNAFMVFFAGLSAFEHFTGHSLLTATRDYLTSLGFNPEEISRYLPNHRFASVWGHPLTSSLYFNAFFAVNIVWTRETNQKKWIPIAAVINLAGQIFSISRTGTVICVALIIIAFWEHKKWFLLAIPVVVILYFMGSFDTLIRRFTSEDIFGGRLKHLTGWIESGVNPLQVFSGYSTNSVFMKNSPLKPYRFAFEIVFLMFASDYGIVFSVIVVIGVYAYVTWRLLRNRRWIPWVCYSGFFLQANIYNAYALRNHDICWMICFLTMIVLNLAEGKESPKEP